MTTEQPRTTPSADRPGRLTADGLRRGISRWWYLVFLSSLVFEPMFASVAARTGVADGPDVSDWVLAIALIVVGAVLVVVGGLGAVRTTMVVAVLLTLLGAATVWFNSAATVFMVYAAGFVAAAASRRTARLWFIGLPVLLLLLAIGSPNPMPFRLAAFAAPIVLVWLIGSSVMTDV